MAEAADRRRGDERKAGGQERATVRRSKAATQPFKLAKPGAGIILLMDVAAMNHRHGGREMPDVLPKLLPTAIVTLLALLGTATVGATSTPVVFTTVTQGTTSGIHTAMRIVIHDSAAWRILWQKHSREGHSAALPLVDFSRDMVIAVFAGNVPQFTRVSILRISREGARLVVAVRTKPEQAGPGPTVGGTDSPFHIVRLPRSTLPVVFTRIDTPDKDTDKPGG